MTPHLHDSLKLVAFVVRGFGRDFTIEYRVLVEVSALECFNELFMDSLHLEVGLSIKRFCLDVT